MLYENCDHSSTIGVVLDDNVDSKATTLASSKDGLPIAFTLHITIRVSPQSMKERTRGPLSTAHRDVHSYHGHWLDYLIRDLPSSQPSPNQLYHPGHRRARRYSPLIQKPLPGIFQDQQDIKPPRIDKLAILPPTRTSIHPPRRFQVPLESNFPPALHHHLEVADLALQFFEHK